MVTTEFKHGIFRRKVFFSFDLAALRRASMACKLDLGEFYSSEKVNDDLRTFYYSYGAWLNGKEHDHKYLKKYAKMYRRFSVDKINKIKIGIETAGIVSAELKRLLTETVKTEKKNY